MKTPILVLAALCALVVTGRADSPRVWPEPPAAPRIQFVRSVRSPADLGMKLSGWTRLSGWVTGRETNAGQFSRPFGVALDEAGNLCVTDTGAGCVWYFDLQHCKFHRWDRMGKIAFNSPVAAAKQGDMILVADSGLGSVVAFDTGGKVLFTLTEPLSRPTAVAIESNRIYVADSQIHYVAVFDTTGKYVSSFGERGTGSGEFNFPTHLGLDRRGDVLVTDSMNARVEVFDAGGHYQGSIGGPGKVSGRFSRPKGVAVDAFGHVYVVDALFDNFQVFDLTGQLLMDVGSNGAGPGEFWLPSGIAIGADNQIYVADSYNGRVQIFKYTGPP